MTGDPGQTDLQRALARFMFLHEEERRRLAHAIHDDTIQPVLATLWSLDDLAESPERPGHDAIDQARVYLREAIAAARALIAELRPPLLDELGLVAALEQQLARLADETSLEVKLVSELTWRLPSHLETLAFRATEEALRDVRRHTGTSLVTVHIRAVDGMVEVVVDDDGVGREFGGGSRPAGGLQLGLVSMGEAVAIAGGSFIVGAGPDGGTRVSFTVPAAPAG